MKSQIRVLLFLAASVAGCTSSVNHVHEIPPVRTPALPTQIQLIPYDPSKTDRILDSEERPTVWGSLLTGPDWTRVFSGSEESGVVLKLTDTKMQLAGGRYLYHVTGTFLCNDKDLEVVETYSRSSFGKSTNSAFAVVVNDALSDLSMKGMAFAKKCAEKEPVSVSAPNNDRYADLERLKKLLDAGVLTRDEFDREKAKILND